MKKVFLTAIAVISLIPFVSKAQWLPNGATTGDIYYNSGNVGISTNTPVSPLTIGYAGTVQSSNGITLGVGQNNIELLNSTYGSGFGAKIYGVDSGNGLTTLRIATRGNSTAWTDALSITAKAGSTGNAYVGIGTTNPIYKLHVEGGAAYINEDNLSTLGGQLTISNGYGNQNGAVRLNFNNGGAVNWIKGIVTGPNTNTGSALIFGVASNTSDGIERMRIDASGNMGIGTADPQGYKLAVNGNIRAKEIKVETGWSDYVFYSTYKLLPISEVAKYIKANQHLPDVPSAAEVEKNGLNVGESNALLLKKIEELTLYLIEKDREVKLQQTQNQAQQQQIDDLRRQVETLLKKKS
ncbi:hypothetical protein [Mucilaginibacter boryungensis]|uniref:Endosialidase-like protein n=1 Tax=Mucilaginibacter boryungensis TaxID=768480 RepID=A0ABR9XMF2_9SPHI|nr:hypothetical protein [Mucilaginibacter boryungensis]MBE9668274.1 hypothetical protein [Mucilaginibacter boryungensis]